MPGTENQHSTSTQGHGWVCSEMAQDCYQAFAIRHLYGHERVGSLTAYSLSARVAVEACSYRTPNPAPYLPFALSWAFLADPCVLPKG
jgi:hypothetical protein